jgi:acetyltransferase-like isoleucine patch superfamily enzyme
MNSALFSRLKLWRCAKVGARVKVLGRVYVVGGGHIEVGDDVVIDRRLVPVELNVGSEGTLIIGDGCEFEGGASIEAQERVELGPHCRLRAFSKVMDNHFHPVVGSRHHRPQSTPVKLEANVEVGSRAIVLPGAWLGHGVHLASGVVIGRRVKAGLALVGSPPRVERREAS